MVKTVLKESQIEGIGLFANQDILKGTCVWEFKEGFDLEIDPAMTLSLSNHSREQFLKYAYLSKKSNNYILCFDDARFFNHCDSPNVSCHPNVDSLIEDICIANRDILKGEELTCNYLDFDAGPIDDFIYKTFLLEANNNK